MKKTPDNGKEGNHVFTEEEEGNVLLQQLDDTEESTKTFEEPDHQERRKCESPNEFEQPEEAQEIKDVVHQNLSVPQGDDPPKGSIRNNIITVCSVTIWATGQIVLSSFSGGFLTVLPLSAPRRPRPPSAGHCSSLVCVLSQRSKQEQEEEQEEEEEEGPV